MLSYYIDVGAKYRIVYDRENKYSYPYLPDSTTLMLIEIGGASFHVRFRIRHFYRLAYDANDISIFET
jgi:hypothetical protein